MQHLRDHMIIQFKSFITKTNFVDYDWLCLASDDTGSIQVILQDRERSFIGKKARQIIQQAFYYMNELHSLE